MLSIAAIIVILSIILVGVMAPKQQLWRVMIWPTKAVILCNFKCEENLNIKLKHRTCLFIKALALQSWLKLLPDQIRI
jgi:hypothetical protein